MNEHTAECLAAFERHEREAREYAENWPRHCKTCEGRGGEMIAYDPSPAGVGLSPGFLYDFEPCPVCIAQGRCARCGSVLDGPALDGDGPCPHCGWREGEDGVPQGPECFCRPEGEPR